jgi:L-fuconate dehydratase
MSFLRRRQRAVLCLYRKNKSRDATGSQSMSKIANARIFDARYDLPAGAGSDAMHKDPQYGYAVTVLETDDGLKGTGIAYTLGDGTNLICEAIKLFVPEVLGQCIDDLMAHFGNVQKRMADHPRLRWLGPHKGVTHSALASITNACFDLWAKRQGLPLWKLLLKLSPSELVNLIDLSYLEDVLPREEAINIVAERVATRTQREHVLVDGYPAYDTSAGWFNYSDEKLVENVKHARDSGFCAVKLKVGSSDPQRDMRRLSLVREHIGTGMHIMLDANQAWSLPAAIKSCRELSTLKPFFIEEPTQPDDILGHQQIAQTIAPIPVAVGEAVANRVQWKNYFQASAVGVVQADCTRLAGISEYLAVVLMATKFPVIVIPHVGDMGQIHSHMVLFNRIALNHSVQCLEYIPHLRQYFDAPVDVKNGRYLPSERPGAGTDIKLDTTRFVGCVEAR